MVLIHGPRVTVLLSPKKYTQAELLQYVAKVIMADLKIVNIPELFQPVAEYVFFFCELWSVSTSHWSRGTHRIRPDDVRFYGRLGEMQPLLDPILTKDVVIRSSLDEELSRGALVASDLGISPRAIETIAIGSLRRYRSHTFHDDLLEEEK